MPDALEDLQIDVLTVTIDRVTGRVDVNYEGMNFLEAIGILTVALNQVQDEPYLDRWDDDDEEDPQ